MRLILHIFLSLAAVCTMVPAPLHAQDSTHVITVKDIAPKKRFFERFTGTFSIAPHYSSEMGLGVAISYTCAKPLAIVADITTEGYMLVGVNGSGDTKNGKWLYSYRSFYNYAPSYFWGLGYDAANISGNKRRYDQKKFLLQGEMRYRFSPRFSLGPSLGYEWIRWEDLIIDNASSNVLQYGIVAQYDSRDHSTNPSRGANLLFRQRNWTNLSGSTSLQANGYLPVWKGGILAAELYSVLTYGDMSISMLPTLGGTERMRGYYWGRYRNSNLICGQLEIRQRIWEMIGGAIWAGAANLWGDYGHFEWRNTLPNYGIGARYYMTERLCLRMDYGFGKKGQNAFIISINEAF